jgi:hypothetical protein
MAQPLYENAVLGGGSRSVTTLMAATSSIFIGSGELGKVMGHFRENPVLAAEVNLFLAITLVLLTFLTTHD